LSSPYQLQENDEFSYEFITDQKIRYKVYFLDYSYMFSDYPNIDSPFYSFNIDAIEGNPDNSSGDERVGLTILEIMKAFFDKIENVAIYVCDSMDERQFARKRKFDHWFFMYNDGSLLKEDGLAIIEGMEVYNAMLLHKKNKQLTDIILAFKDLNEKAGEK
jgi:hypothetical protein